MIVQITIIVLSLLFDNRNMYKLLLLKVILLILVPKFLCEFVRFTKIEILKSSWQSTEIVKEPR